MSKTQHYPLNIDEIPNIIEGFVKELGEGYSHQYNEDLLKKTITIKITKNAETAILICYIKDGQVSFNCQGKNNEIAERCKEALIKDASINAIDKKVFTIKNVSEDDFNAVVEFLLEEFNITWREPNENEKKSFSLNDEHDAHLTVHYYNTGTLMAQGKVTTLFMGFVSTCSELLSPDEIKEGQINFFEVSAESVHAVEESLKDYVPEGYDKIEGKLENVMYPSLVLLNHPFELQDYSCYAYPVLRGIEGVLKKRISEEIGDLRGLENFKNFFEHKNNSWTFSKACDIFNTDELKHAMLNLYGFYYKNRHTTFHMDATVETSRTLDYDVACDVVKEGLGLIGKLCKHW